MKSELCFSACISPQYDLSHLDVSVINSQTDRLFSLCRAPLDPPELQASLARPVQK